MSQEELNKVFNTEKIKKESDIATMLNKETKSKIKKNQGQFSDFAIVSNKKAPAKWEWYKR